MSTRVAVVGGGIAGLSCACDLADAGVEVVLLEAKKNLGGRAYAFHDEQSGAVIDNCQHVLLGCCNEATTFLDRIGSGGSVDYRDEIRFVASDGKELRVKQSALPAPLHLAPSLFNSGYLSLKDKVGLARAVMAAGRRAPVDGISAADYLKQLSCSPSVVEKLLEPILVSALNEELSTASAQSARMVLLKSLVESRDGYRLGVPKAPFSEVLEAPASRYLAMRGCNVRLATRVEKLYVSGKLVNSLVLEKGHRMRCDMYVMAVPPWSLERMGLTMVGGEDLIWRAIVGVHLFLDEFDATFDCACIAGEPFGWVFNKTSDFGLGFGYVQAVASGADGIVGLDKDTLVEMAMRAAAKASPGLAKPVLKRAVVYRAQRATFSTGSPAGMARPSCLTPVANMFVAGDWTETGWPATMESAVRSGRAAAQAVLDRVP